MVSFLENRIYHLFCLVNNYPTIRLWNDRIYHRKLDDWSRSYHQRFHHSFDRHTLMKNKIKQCIQSIVMAWRIRKCFNRFKWNYRLRIYWLFQSNSAYFLDDLICTKSMCFQEVPLVALDESLSLGLFQLCFRLIAILAYSYQVLSRTQHIIQQRNRITPSRIPGRIRESSLKSNNIIRI